MKRVTGIGGIFFKSENFDKSLWISVYNIFFTNWIAFSLCAFDHDWSSPLLGIINPLRVEGDKSSGKPSIA